MTDSQQLKSVSTYQQQLIDLKRKYPFPRSNGSEKAHIDKITLGKIEDGLSKIASEKAVLAQKVKAISERERVNKRLRDYRERVVVSAQGDIDDISAEIDYKAKASFYNNRAYEEKVITVEKLMLTLYYLVFMAFVNTLWYIGIVDNRLYAWILLITVGAYIYQMFSTFYTPQLKAFWYALLRTVMPWRVDRVCEETGKVL